MWKVRQSRGLVGVAESGCCSGEGSVSEGFESGWWYG